MASISDYVGRFAPSPSGPLHAGSLVAALASWLDAKAHGGRWLLRVEDVDGPRTAAGAEQKILRQLAALQLHPDRITPLQSERNSAYQAALEQLIGQQLAYPCVCSKRDIELALAEQDHQPKPGLERIYPGTCAQGIPKARMKTACAWRLRVGTLERPIRIEWQDRLLGPQSQNVTLAVGDFVLRRSDGPWAYQLAVVIDDADQAVTHVVRGQDLADNTPRQNYLQALLGLPRPRYLHTPLVLDAFGQKLSKSKGAQPLDEAQAFVDLSAAAQVLGLPKLEAKTQHDWLAQAVKAWQHKHCG